MPETRTRWYPYLTILPALLLIGLFTVYPVAVAIKDSVYQYILTKPGSHPFVGLRNFREVIRSYYFLNSLGITGLYTLASVAGIFLFGLAVASLLNTRIRLAAVLKVIILLPWAIPSVVAGLLWKWILNGDFGILNGILFSLKLIPSYISFLSDPLLARISLVLAQVWKEGSLAAIFFLAGLQLIPAELYEAARMDGCRTWRLFRSITFPLLRPIALVVLVYETMTSILTFDTIYVLTGGGPADSTALISWFAYAEIFKSLNLGHGIALSIIIALMTLALIFAYLRIMRTEASR
jgi:multiple sugar transport system permease protein